MKYLIGLIFILTVGLSKSDPGTPSKEEPSWLVSTRKSISSEKYDQAIELLKESNQVSSADWNNLMGFSLRQKQPPDLLGAEYYYQAALNIYPKHRGALEYYGILKLTNGDLAGAEALLIKLDKACFFGCEEYYDLKKSIEKYKKESVKR